MIDFNCQSTDLDEEAVTAHLVLNVKRPESNDDYKYERFGVLPASESVHSAGQIDFETINAVPDRQEARAGRQYDHFKRD